VLVFTLTWSMWVPRAAGIPVGVVGQLWTWVPAISALLAAGLTGGRAAVGDLGSRLVRWRVGWRWYAVVIFGPAAFSGAVALLYALLGGSWAAAAPPVLRGGTPLVFVPLFLLVLFLTDGLGEELAWRGFALPRFALPVAPRLRRPRGELDPGDTVGSVAPPARVDRGRPAPPTARMASPPGCNGQVDPVYVGVFLHTRGSVFLAALLHATTNLFVVSPVIAEGGSMELLLLAAFAKWALVVVVLVVAGPGLAKGQRPGALPMS
jgi:uncharacterized protein